MSKVHQRKKNVPDAIWLPCRVKMPCLVSWKSHVSSCGNATSRYMEIIFSTGNFGILHVKYYMLPRMYKWSYNWVVLYISNSEIIPPDLGYTIYRKDRCDRYGGVMIVIVQSLSSCEILIPNVGSEILWVQFKSCNGHQNLVGTFYRPNAAVCTPLEELDMSLHTRTSW